MTRLIASAAAILVLGVATFAQAAEPVATIRVSAAGLDLSRGADAVLMMGRLDRAALNICGAGQFSAPQYRDATRREACYAASLSQAVAALNAPVVTALSHHAEYRLAAN